jgi:hypothetical protein
MQKIHSVLWFILFIFILTGNNCIKQPVSQHPMEAMLPSAKEVPDWPPSDEPQIVEKDDLYLIINGGAEMYYEYGFKQALFQTYHNGDRTINLEIYEMEDTPSAYGIYSFKKGEKGLKLSFGHEALLETYYLNVWKGPFLITAIGFDSDIETINGLASLARAIDSKIEAEPEKPSILSYALTQKAKKVCVIEGHLGLFNHYNFTTEDIFQVQQGVITVYSDRSMLLLQYDDQATVDRIFRDVKIHLEAKDHLRDFRAENDFFQFKDRDGTNFFFRAYHDFIWMASGYAEDERDVVFYGWKSHADIQRFVPIIE